MTTDCRTQYYDVGTLIDDRYRLTDFIGAGGMACVYKAQEENTPHLYAVKFMKAEYHNQPYLIDFFRDEASSMRDLAHPNIVRFYRFVNHDEYSYIVMDYVNGFALSDIIKRMYKEKREIPLDEVVRIMTQVARALDAIHREGYVHRDIKPSNVLIERQTGQTFLTDLGITTTSNTRIEGAGTLAYMPPETSATGVADHRADIYSYGVMFFEMLAKQRPFRVDKGLSGQAAEENLKRKHREAAVPDITTYRPDLPDALNDVMQKALAKSPQQRYNSIMELARDIHAALKPDLSADMQDFTSITHRQITPPEALSQSGTVSQKPLLLVLGIVGAAIILIGMALAGSALTNTTPTAVSRTRIVGAVSTATSAPPTLTPTATLSPTPNPVEQQPFFPLVTGIDALAEPDTADALFISPAEDGSLRYLRVGQVDGFRLELEVRNAENVSRYGVAFRLQDSQNYVLFALSPETGAWTIEEVRDGVTTVVKDGQISGVINPLVVTGRSSYVQIEAGQTVIDYTPAAYPLGSLALWVESPIGGALELSSLIVGLIGEEAVAAAETTPTPAPGIADPRRFLRADVQALLATNDVINSAIDCPRYIDIYETLDRNLESDSASVRRMTQQTLDAGAVVYSRCRSESPNESLAFVDAIQDYLDWESELRRIWQELAE